MDRDGRPARRDDQPGADAGRGGPRRGPQVGKDADLALWSGDWLDLQSRVLRTWIDGVEVYAYDQESGTGTVRPR